MSNPLEKLNERIEALEKASEEMREATREGRELLKELRKTHRQITDDLNNIPHDVVEKELNLRIGEAVVAINEMIEKTCDKVTKDITKEYKAFARMMISQFPDIPGIEKPRF